MQWNIHSHAAVFSKQSTDAEKQQERCCSQPTKWMARILFSPQHATNKHITCLCTGCFSWAQSCPLCMQRWKIPVQMASQLVSLLLGTITTLTALLPTELSPSPTESGSSFRAYFTAYSPDGSLPKGKISSGEHVHFFYYWKYSALTDTRDESPEGK